MKFFVFVLKENNYQQKMNIFITFSFITCSFALNKKSLEIHVFNIEQEHSQWQVHQVKQKDLQYQTK